MEFDCAGDLESSCADMVDMCGKWAKEGECQKNEEYMKANCMLSCNICKPTGQPWEISYKRSYDYLHIVERTRQGVWTAPFAFGMLLIKSHALPAIMSTFFNVTADAPTYSWATSTMIAHSVRKAGGHIYVSNLQYFGNIIDDTDYPETRANPDLYLIENNGPEWEETYLHPSYSNWRSLGMANDSRDGHV